MSGERAERNDRDATMDGHRGGGGRVSKEKAKSSEDLDVEEFCVLARAYAEIC